MTDAQILNNIIDRFKNKIKENIINRLGYDNNAIVYFDSLIIYTQRYFTKKLDNSRKIYSYINDINQANTTIGKYLNEIINFNVIKDIEKDFDKSPNEVLFTIGFQPSDKKYETRISFSSELPIPLLTCSNPKMFNFSIITGIFASDSKTYDSEILNCTIYGIKVQSKPNNFLEMGIVGFGNFKLNGGGGGLYLGLDCKYLVPRVYSNIMLVKSDIPNIITGAEIIFPKLKVIESFFLQYEWNSIRTGYPRFGIILRGE